VAASLLTGYAPVGSTIVNGLVPSLPFFLLAGMLLLGRLPLSSRRDVAEGTRSVATSSHHLVRGSPRGRSAAMLRYGVGGVLAVGALLLALLAFNSYWTAVLAQATSFAVLFLSFSIATGEGGILCLGQAALGATGAFVAGRLASEARLPIVVAVLSGIAAAGGAGAILGLIGVRLDRVGFALITLAFALFCEQFAFNTTSLVPINGVSFPNIKFGGLRATQSQIVLGTVVFTGIAVMLAVIRRGRIGRAFAAIRGNPVSGEALGLNVRAMRIGVFALGSGVAGLGGVLFGFNTQLLNPADFTLALGLVWVAVVVTVGVRGFMGALVAGLLYSVVPAAFALVHVNSLHNLPPVLFGLGAVGLAQESRGMLAQWNDAGRVLAARIRREPGRESGAALDLDAAGVSAMSHAGDVL